jgi:diguanylate cyclase (GGDEF)-like protein
LIRPFNINLLSGLVLTIILLGVISAAAVYVNARTYRDLAFDFQRQYMTRLMEAKTGDMLLDEVHQAQHAGLKLLEQDAFRAAYALRDADELAAVLAGFFQHEAASAAALKITGLYVFGVDADLLAAAGRPGTAAGGGAVICPGLVRLARLQTGENNLQPLHELCALDGVPSMATLIAIGEESAPGFLQVVSDPLPRLVQVGSRLDMPVQVRRMDDSIVYATPGWVAESGSNEVMSDFVLSAADTQPLLRITARRSADALVLQLDRTNNRLLLVVALIILTAVVFALLMVKYSVFKPLRDLSYQFRISRNRDTDAAATAADRNDTPVSFHALGELYETLHDMAIRDPLTGTYNRALLEDRLKQVIAEHRRTPCIAAILLVDLVRFKYVNDVMGHHVGDLLLKKVVDRISQVLRESDTLARLGGDEFVIVLPDTDAEQASQVAQKITQSMEHDFEVEGHKLSAAVSIGIALMPEHGDDVETLLRNADYAMYSIKNDKRDYAVYDPATAGEANSARMTLGGVLDADFGRNDLFLVYQPVMEFDSGRVSYLEALVRWRQPDGRILMPESFIRVAEQSGMIQQLSEWVVDNVCRELATLQQDNPGLRAGLNLSMHNLHDLNLMEQIRTSLQRYRLEPQSLLLEITETGVMMDPDQVTSTLGQLADMGLRLSIDDFGTGHSSLVYLKRLPVHTLKVDKSFVVDMDSDEDNASIVRATIDLAHSLGLTVTAEGVETGVVHDQLKTMGCDYYQGYYVGRPTELPGIGKWLLGNRITQALTTTRVV